MRILFVSKQGDGLGVADRLAQEGHDIRFWASDQMYARDLQGVLGRVDTWRPSVPWCDLAIADIVGYSHLAPVFNRYGKPILSMNPVGDVIELDRSKAITTASTVGMQVPRSFAYSSPKEAAGHKWSTPVFVKPSGNLRPGETRKANTPTQYSWIMSQHHPDQELLVQEVVNGIEISTEGWFNGTDWIKPFNHTFEEKKLMPGETGPGTGCMGNVVLPAQEDRLVQETLIKMTPFLRKAGYRGPLDINTIITKDAAYFLEFTSRMGYDAVEALATGLREPLGALLFETATGTKKEMALTKDYMVAVRLCQPPYPNDGKSTPSVPLEGIVPENRKYIFLTGVQKRGANYLTSGSDGVVGKVTATGRSVGEARSRAYRTLSNIKGIDLFFRPDIGERVPGDITQLKEWGWL